MSASGSRLEATHLSAGYGANLVVQDVSFAATAAEVVTIVGPNGAGKSTFLKALMGFLDRQAGEVTLDGTDIGRARPFERVVRGLGYVPQLSNVFGALSVQENLAMGGYRLERSELRRHMEAQLALFPQLGERRRQLARTLSGGERQMLAMARALMTEPKFLLLDEPSAALSPAMAETVFQRIEEVHARRIGIILVEQDVFRALEISDRGYVLANGRNVFDGEATALMQDERMREAYLGEDPT